MEKSSSIAGPSSRPMEQRKWPPRLYLAVDCGGTKAAAAICDENGQLIGKGRGGPSNFTDEGLQSFLTNVEDAITDALENIKRHFTQIEGKTTWQCSEEEEEEQQQQNEDTSTLHPIKTNVGKLDAGNKSRITISNALQSLKPDYLDDESPHAKFRAAWFGIAGVDSPADVTLLSPHLAKMLDLPFPSTRLIVANDTSLLASPITDVSRPGIQSGVVVISGTGSIVMSFRRSRSGMLKVLGRVGGFGWVLGDEGSGYSVGRDAVRKVLNLADRERLAREKDDMESDSEESQEDGNCSQRNSFSSDVDRDVDPSGDMSRSTLTDKSTATLSTQPTSSPIRETSENRNLSLQRAEIASKVALQYGHMLRDRILQDWSLLSTDELLRAVYFDDAPPTGTTTANFSKNFPGVPTIIQSSSFSSNSPLPNTTVQAETSLNLLPPSASTKIEEYALNRRYSPIPSLSSSPSDSSSTAIYPASLKHAYHSHRSESAVNTENSSVASSFYSPDPYSPSSTSERKHRLASLAPLVFHLAFTHDDQLCLDILRSQAYLIALQIRDILQPSSRAKAHISSQSSILCLGGGLVGQSRYRNLLLEELKKVNIVFAAVEYVSDPATRGAMALSTVLEQRPDRV